MKVKLLVPIWTFNKCDGLDLSLDACTKSCMCSSCTLAFSIFMKYSWILLVHGREGNVAWSWGATRIRVSCPHVSSLEFNPMFHNHSAHYQVSFSGLTFTPTFIQNFHYCKCPFQPFYWYSGKRGFERLTSKIYFQSF